VADPSQQLAWSDGPTIRRLIEGAAVLMSNEYESALIAQKTGWTDADILERVAIKVVTLGPAGARVERRGEDPIVVHAVPGVDAVEPTGVGDAFRAGFVGAMGAGLTLECAAQVGCVLAAYVVERIGTQEYSFTPKEFLARMSGAYGEEAASQAEEWLLE
jgi:adenosine kinase